jgi:hypothetical protein
VETPSEYAEIWQRRYAELLADGVPDEKAKLLASELAAAAVLTAVRSRQGIVAPLLDPRASAAAPVLKMAKFDGFGLLIMGVPSMILAFFSSSVSGFAIGALVAFCGWCELDGYKRYVRSSPGARSRLVGSQLILIAGAWAYAGWTLLHPEPLSPEITDLIKESGDQGSEVLGMAANLRVIIAAAICGVTLLYQGGLAYYYWSKTRRTA